LQALSYEPELQAPELQARRCKPGLAAGGIRWQRMEWEPGLDMAGMASLETKPMETGRLRLRRWRDEDREPFARMNDDAEVMEYFPAPLTRAESDELVDRIEAHFGEHGFGAWAAELRDEGTFIGFIGLAVPRFEAHFTPCVEIGWRLAREHWGRGLATEGARAVMRYAFAELGLAELVSFTVPANVRSRRVMEKLGMTHDPGDDFDHPGLPDGHSLRRHVLYRISGDAWRERAMK
jgi:RimJ/RimL family protein N-acetyltransferase